MVILFLIIHILVCILLYLLIRANIMKCSSMVMLLAFFVPVWGPCCLLVLEFRTRGDQEIHEEVGIEKLKINDEIHRSILMEEDPTEGRVVPLEEALLINDPSMRRELMLEIMYEDPSCYISQLQEASMNEDTEVVHYAVTALVELQKKYDLQFQDMEHKMAKDPDDRQLLEDYLELVEQYLGSGLLEGNARNIQLRRYAELLGKKLEEHQDQISLYCKRVDANLKLHEYEEAWQDIRTLLEQWPGDERGYLFLIQYYALTRDRSGISRTLKLLEQREVYLSPKGRSVVQFWNEDYTGKAEA